MKLYFVRHGDKEKGNFFNTTLQHQDEPLSESGVCRAKRMSTYFQDKDIKALYISEYIRTEQTANYIALSKQLNMVKDSRVNEIDNGFIDGMSDEEIKEKYPQFYDDFFSFSKDVRFPGGETGEEVVIRMKDFLSDLINRNQNAIIVCHEGYMRILICYLLGLPVYKRNRFHIDYCGIIEIQYREEQNEWKIIRVNQTND